MLTTWSKTVGLNLNTVSDKQQKRGLFQCIDHNNNNITQLTSYGPLCLYNLFV